MKKTALTAAILALAACQAEENDNEGSPEHENSNGVENTTDQEAGEETNQNETEDNGAAEEQEEDNVPQDEEADAGSDNEASNGSEVSLLDLETEDWQVDTVAENLPAPWSIAPAAGTYYIPSRDGFIMEVGDGRDDIPVETSDEIVQEGEGGLLGFVLGEEEEAWMYYTYENDGLENRIVRAEREEDTWRETEILKEGIEGAAIHNGGRLAIGPDDHLYATTGDADVPEWSQDPERPAGSILRMTQDGEVPEDQPFEDSSIYSYGHRNPQGLAWNKEEELYSSEHGAQALDEVNRIEAGSNYGWPVIEGDETEEGMETPAIHSGDETWAPSGAAFYEDEFVTTGLRGQSLYVFDEENDVMHVTFEGEGRLRDVVYHEGSLYVLTNNTDGRGDPQENDDRLLRLTPPE